MEPVQLELNFDDDQLQAQEEAFFYEAVNDFQFIVEKYGAKKVLEALDSEVREDLGDYYLNCDFYGDPV